jgi:hypothetical protein
MDHIPASRARLCLGSLAHQYDNCHFITSLLLEKAYVTA